MAEWAALTGRRYGRIDAYRCDDAERSSSRWAPSPTRRAVVDALRDEGRASAPSAITGFRPFPAARIADVLGARSAVAVVERTDEPAAADNPLTREIKAALDRRAPRAARRFRASSRSPPASDPRRRRWRPGRRLRLARAAPSAATRS